VVVSTGSGPDNALVGFAIDGAAATQ